MIVGVAGLLSAAVLAPAVEAQDKGKEKALTIEQIMEAAHGEGGLRQKIAMANRKNKLADVKDAADEWVRLAGLLSKQKPSKGGEESWKKYSALYEQEVKNVAAVVKAGKAEGVTRAMLSVNCNGCHNAHKPD